MRQFAISMILIFAAVCFAQPYIEWQHCLGGTYGDYLFSIEPTSDEGYIMAGYTSSNDGDVSGWHPAYAGPFMIPVSDYWVVKIDSLGNIQWQKCLGGYNYECAYEAHQTTDGGYIVAGYSNSEDGDVTGHHGYTTDSDVWVVKLNSVGDLVWEKSLGGTDRDYAYAVQQTVDGGYVIVGKTMSDNGDVSGRHDDLDEPDMWVVKLNSTGTILWQKCLGGIYPEAANSVVSTTDGGCVVAGYTMSNDGDVTGNHGWGDYHIVSDCWIVKLSSTGDILWQKCLGGTRDEMANSIRHTSDGGYIVAGYAISTDGDLTVNNGLEDYWIVKLNSAGDIIWQKSLGGSSFEQARYAIQTSDGNYVVAGYTYSDDLDVIGNHGSRDNWIIELNSSGDVNWKKCFGGTSREAAWSVQQSSDDEFIIAGTSESNNLDVVGHYPLTTCDSTDVWIINLSPTPVRISDKINIPETFYLSAHPNPFNSAVRIAVDMPSVETQNLASLQIEIYDVNGRHIKTLRPSATSGTGPSGLEKGGMEVPLLKGDLGGSFTWQPSPSITSGVYLVRAKIGDESISKRIVYLK